METNFALHIIFLNFPSVWVWINFWSGKIHLDFGPTHNIFGPETRHVKDLYRYGQNTQQALNKHIKPKGTTQFDTFYTLVENSVNSVIFLFWALLQAAKSEIHQKMTMFEELKYQVLKSSQNKKGKRAPGVFFTSPSLHSKF